MLDVKLQDVKQTHETSLSGHDIAEHENAGHEIGQLFVLKLNLISSELYSLDLVFNNICPLP